MVFSSFEFLFRFLPIFLIIYFIVPAKYKNAVLLLGSIAFYTYGEGWYVVLLLASVGVNYIFGRMMYPKPEEGRGNRQKIILMLALIYNFGMLFFFKYSGQADHLPLGISFYTFQIAAYIIDVYRGKVPAEKNLFRLGVYLTMFPQLVAGPIVNYSEVSSALKKRTVAIAQFEEGVRTLITGLAAKVIIADRIGMLWNNIQTIGFNSISTPLAWLGAFAYSIELYFDFSGYSLMAIGLGKMMGFEFPKNFCFPYMSKSITEFWRRWHITLGRWFREYVYIPLGGNRKGKIRTFLNLLVVWSLTALWHGAWYNYLVWGAMLLFLLILEKVFLLKWLEKSKVLSHIYILVTVPVTWVAFAITEIKQLWVYLTRMFPFLGGPVGVINSQDFLKYLSDYIGLFLLGILFATPIPSIIYKRIKDNFAGTLAIAVILVLSLYYLAISNNNPFMYFNF